MKQFLHKKKNSSIHIVIVKSNLHSLERDNLAEDIPAHSGQIHLLVFWSQNNISYSVHKIYL